MSRHTREVMRLALAAALMAAAGCGGGGTAEPGAAAASGAGSGTGTTPLPVEKPQLKLGFIKLTDMVPLAIAYEKGFTPAAVT